MGIVSVAAAAACKALVALAIIRSTPLETKLVAIVVQVLESFCAFWTVISTWSPSASVKASWNPCVAASSASCSICCSTPT